MFKKLAKNRFLFEELVKRDFKKKYKRSVLGVLWSLILPLLQLAVLYLVFGNFFGKTTPHFIVYIFSGNLVYQFYSDATQGGMRSLVSNSGIYSKVNVPKYLFLMSRNIQSLINFGLSLIVYFALVFIDGIRPQWSFFLLIFPILMIVIFNIGVGMILSALFVFFRDIEYLYSVFCMLLCYMSAIFYNVKDMTSDVSKQMLFYLNPVYAYISYFRKIVIYNEIPSLRLHMLCAFYAFVAFGIGCLIYKKNNYRFLYYV